MSDELREIVEEIIRYGDPVHCEEWVKDIKKWAISKCPKKVTAEERECTGGEAKHYNQALADYVKNL